MGSLQAQEGETFSATLSGKEEVPPTDSSATGWAKFQTNDNGTQVSYWINLTGMNEITGAHIHNGSAGQNGDIVVSLSGQQSAENGNDSTISLNGNITQNDLQGPLKGKELSGLCRSYERWGCICKCSFRRISEWRNPWSNSFRITRNGN